MNDAGNGQVTTTPLPSSALASSMATSRTGMEIGFVTTGSVSEKGGRPGKCNAAIGQSVVHFQLSPNVRGTRTALTETLTLHFSLEDALPNLTHLQAQGLDFTVTAVARSDSRDHERAGGTDTGKP